jgi:hypothetical protein
MLNINKNFGFKEATADWVFNLDADERVSLKLKKEILKVLSSPQKENISGYEIPRKNIIFGRWIQHGLWWPDFQLRLFKKNKGQFPCIHVHEKIKVSGKVEKLKQPIIHYNYQTIEQFIDKLNHLYTNNEAEILLKSGKKLNWYDAVRMPTNDFLSNFFARQGYKDGLHGLVLSLLQAFYSLTVFLKAWERQKFWQFNNRDFINQTHEEFKQSQKQINHWFRKVSKKNPLSFLKHLFNL